MLDFEGNDCDCMRASMKRILFVLLLMTCSVSWAGWERISKTNSYVEFIDRETIRKKDDFVEIWVMRSYFKKQKHQDIENIKSAKALHRFDCINQTVKWLYGEMYASNDGLGSPLFSSPPEAASPDYPVSPSSDLEKIFKIACGLK